MSGLSREAQKLVQAGRDSLRPTAADRERVFQALLPRIGGSPVGTEVDPSSLASEAAKASLVKISAVIVGLGVAGGGLLVALRPAPEPATVAAPAPVKLAPIASPRDETPANNDVPESVPSATPRAPTPAGPAEKRVAPRPAASGLAQEVAILSRASAELHAGRPAAALAALDEHQRKFPGGVLAQERAAARIQALCALGRTGEARAAIARLARTSPTSPHLARARKACGLDQTKAE